MKKYIGRVVVVGVLVVFGAVIVFNQLNKTSAFLNKHGIEGTDVKEIVAHLEETLDEPASLFASINGSELMMSDGQSKVSMELPENMFYVSVAPYINQTHPCSIHNLITCRGELQNETFTVTVIDNKSNEVVFDEQVNSYSNGFFGIWLPKEIEGTITVSRGDKTASTTITTYKQSNTCLTTLQLT